MNKDKFLAMVAHYMVAKAMSEKTKFEPIQDEINRWITPANPE